MSNKSGASSQIISLPKGGGALHGIGETFSPDLFTGTGNFTVPIALPPGRNGFQPELNLVYSTGSGNGPFGLGWSLSIPRVSRKTSKGIPRYDDDRDVFILSGAEDLVPVKEERSETDTERRLSITYRPRTEGLFARIHHHRVVHLPDGPVQDYWEVRSKDGLVSYYGTPKLPENADKTWQDPGVIANPTNRSNIFSWSLTQTRDPFENLIVYDYDRDSGTDGPHHWERLYLKRIRYADYGDRKKPKFLVSVTFEYEDRSEFDSFSEYRSGFEIRTRKRCRRIEIRTHADRERLARTYQFIYLDRREDLADLESLLPLNGVSLLSQIEAIGHDEDNPNLDKRREELPPLEFRYTNFEPKDRDFFPIEGRDLPARSLANPELELAGLFGNGLPDILEMNGTVRYWRNLGNGRFDLPREMSDAPAGLRLADPGVQLLDADGDGRIDLLVNREGLSGYFPLQFGGLWDRRSLHRYSTAPSFDLEAPNVQLVDLTGDGVTDAIRSGSRLECFFNHPQEGWTETRFVERREIEDFPDINFSDPRVRWGDMSGDGLQDIVLVYDGNIEYWPNLGYGDWGQRISMRNSPHFRYGYDPRRILIGDVDGDGLADLVYVDDNEVILWINQSGNGWSDPIFIKGTPSVTDMDAVRLVDLLGTGVAGVLWSADAPGPSRSGMFFLDFTGGVKPYLLHQMDNHMGAVTRVGYASSIQNYLEDEKHPETRWKTPLPFSVQVVAQVEVIDRFSQGKLTTAYTYHHGYWDGAEREFRGFGRVEQLDTEVFEAYWQSGLHGADTHFEPVAWRDFSPPLLTKTWFHQGPVGDEFGDWGETDYRAEFWTGDPPLLHRSLELEDFLRGLPRRVRRDALRTLRGRILRTELYALDDTLQQERPYTVTEALHGVMALPLDEAADPDTWQPWQRQIFFPHQLGQRVTQWERGTDPMTQFGFTENYDRYGQPRRQIAIACPRGWDGMADARPCGDGEQGYLATVTETTFAQRDDGDRYQVDRVATTTAYEITETPRQPLLDLKRGIADGTVVRTINGQTLNFYDGEPFVGADLEVLEDYGALVRSETLVLTEDMVRDEVYPIEDIALDGPPPYLVGEPWTGEYPEAFRPNVPSRAGYVFRDDVETATGYFAITTQRRYDVQDGPGRGLVLAMQDPLGHTTTITYDDYDLLPEQVTDPVGLVTAASYDYRVLQPDWVNDPNGNAQVFGFTPLGMPASVAAIDETGEGDTEEQPSSWFEYDFLAFDAARQPIAVRTIQRVHHPLEPDVPDAERDYTITKVEYSDGFGRLLQTRTQGEAVRFGNPIFGGDILPVDRDDETETRQPIVGQTNTNPDRPNVVVSGWQVYDNKGRVVGKYEPFFSVGWNYGQPLDTERGQRVRMVYDPRGQVIRTLNPDGSEQWVIYGIPHDLSDPERYDPTPWEAYTYDANDLAPLSRKLQSDGTRVLLTDRAPEQHHFTPSSITLDALGRTIRSVERNGTNPEDDYCTRSTYDIRGNLLTVTDALGREAFRYAYDLTPKRSEEDEGAQVLRIEQLDGGIRRLVLDAAGNELERRDNKGAMILRAYDALNRPTDLWARDGAGQQLTHREHLVYGDSVTEPDVTERNLRGKLYQHYDEAGLLTFERYDFKGNGLEKIRRAIGDEAILSVFPTTETTDWSIQAFRVDWPTETTALETYREEILEAAEHRTSLTYDGLNRIKTMQYPEDVDHERKVLRPTYNRVGALEAVTLDEAPYVERIAYNAKGQRILVAYGNGVMTRYGYDPQTFRLVRLRSEDYELHELTYTPQGAPLQDLAYRYDLAGNITAIQERTPGSGVQGELLGADALDRVFTYDPLYRLLSATGRECSNLPQPRPWTDELACGTGFVNRRGTPTTSNAPQLTSLYRETYAYDPVGNMLTMEHQQAIRCNGGSSWQTQWSRNFGMGGLTPEAWNEAWPLHLTGDWSDPPTNRLTHVQDRRSGETTTPLTHPTHRYDANGNLTQENEARHFEWDHSDRLRVFRTQTGTSEPSVHAHYLYDASGQRVKKLVRKGRNQVEVTVYVDGVFELHQLQKEGEEKENNTLHVMDDQQRIALVRVGEPFEVRETTPAVQYHLGNHLGSSNVVIGDAGELVNREEYTPYGETSFGSFDRKRYRFSGKERDVENGFNYHEKRYYIPYLGIWIQPDPYLWKRLIRKNSTVFRSSYLYVRNNPLMFVDPNGLEGITLTGLVAIFIVLTGIGTTSTTTGATGRNPNMTAISSEFQFPLTIDNIQGVESVSILHTEGALTRDLGHTMMLFRFILRDTGETADYVFSFALSTDDFISVVTLEGGVRVDRTLFLFNPDPHRTASVYGPADYSEFVLNISSEQGLAFLGRWLLLVQNTPRYSVTHTNCASVIIEMLHDILPGASSRPHGFGEGFHQIDFPNDLRNALLQEFRNYPESMSLVREVIHHTVRQGRYEEIRSFRPPPRPSPVPRMRMNLPTRR